MKTRIEKVKVKDIIQAPFLQQRSSILVLHAPSFDWKLFGTIDVAEYPDGKQEMYNGRERLYLAQLEGIETVPATITQVDELKDVHKLYDDLLTKDRVISRDLFNTNKSAIAAVV
jgi:hypothetical protein